MRKANEYMVSVITKIGMVSVGLLYSILLARYLGASTKGTISYIQSIVAIVSIILSFGMHQAYPYYRKISTDKKQFISEYMSTLLVLFFLFFCIALLLSFTVEASNEIRYSILLSPLWAYTRVCGYVFLVERPNKRNISLLLLSIAETVYVLILFMYTKSSLLLGVSAITFVEISKAILFTVWAPFKFSLKYVRIPLIKTLAKYGFFPMIALLMTTLNYRIDVLMLKNSPSILLSQVGIYSIGSSLAEKALLIPDAIKEILLSKLAKGKGSDEVTVVSRLCFFISIVVAAFIVAVGKPFIEILYGAEYSGAYLVTAISVSGTVFMVFFKMIGQYNIVNRKQVINTMLLAVSIITNVVLNRLLIPCYGINGAAVATVAGHIVCAALFISHFSRNTNVPINDIVFLKRNDITMMKKAAMLVIKKKTTNDGDEK